jgi:hypothetical protein
MITELFLDLVLERKNCDVCGAPLKSDGACSYDPWTGEPVMRMVCSQEPCKHRSAHKGVPYRPGELSGFFVGPDAFRCARCGEVYTEGGDVF